MQISYDYEAIPITKEEYEKNSYKRKNDSIIEKLIELKDKYFKVPIYSGIQSMIDNKPIKYKYYKRGKYKSYLICGEKEYKSLRFLMDRYFQEK